MEKPQVLLRDIRWDEEMKLGLAHLCEHETLILLSRNCHMKMFLQIFGGNGPKVCKNIGLREHLWNCLNNYSGIKY